MSITPDEQSVAISSDADSFLQRMRRERPFASNRVSSQADAQVHVTEIHQSAWNQLVQCADEARYRPRGGLGVVVWGDPGVGKSHLLARYSRWVETEGQGLFVPLHNILAAPRLIPRYLLKCVMSRLAPSHLPWRETVLYDIVRRVLRRSVEATSGGNAPVTIHQAWSAFRRFAEQHFMNDLPLSVRQDAGTLWAVLLRFYVGVYYSGAASDDASRQFAQWRATLALRVLRGEGLDAAEIADLGLPPDSSLDADAGENDQWIESALLVLLELARLDSRLLVLCFDQVENLSEERFIELARFNHALIDHGRNLLVITSGVRADLLGFVTKKLVPAAAWDRIQQQRVELTYIQPEQARRLIEARLEAFLQPLSDVPDVQGAQTQDPLFPLGSAWFAAKIGDMVEVRPRDVLSWSDQRWREQVARLNGSEAANWWSEWSEIPSESNTPVAPRDEQIDELLHQKIQEYLARLKKNPSAMPPDESSLLNLIARLLRRLLAWPETYAIVRVADAENSPYNLLVETRDAHGSVTVTGIRILVTENATSAAVAYRRIVEDPTPPQRVIILEDGRQPIRLGARGQQHRTTLEQRGPEQFRVIALTFEELIDLAALEMACDDAHSGDLEIARSGEGSTTVTPEEVEESHHRSGRYRRHRLLETLCGTHGAAASSPPAAPATHPTGEQLEEAILEQLQQKPGLSSVEVTERLGTQFGVNGAEELAQLRRDIESAAQRMHEQQRLNAAPANDHLYLLLKP